VKTGYLRSCLFLFLPFIASCSGGIPVETLYTSYFGFQVRLPEDWIGMNPRDISAATAQESLASLKIDGFADASALESILNRVKSGEVEFYFDKTTLNEEDRDNVSAQLVTNDWGVLTDEHIPDLCTDLPKQLTSMFNNSPVTVDLCTIARANGIAYFKVEYSVPAMSYHVVQYEIPFRNQTRLVVVGGTFKSGRRLQRMREVQALIAEAATDFAASQG